MAHSATRQPSSSRARDTSRASPFRLLRRLIPRTIRGVLLVFLLVVLVPLVTVQAIMFYDRYEVWRAYQFRENREVAWSVGALFKGYAHNVARTELALGTALAAINPLPPDLATSLLKTTARDQSSIRLLMWLDGDGRILATSTGEGVGVSLSDHSYFQEVATGADWVIGDLLLGRITGLPTFTISRGIRADDGVLLGVVVASIDPTTLGSELRIERTRPGSVAILDRNGWLAYHYPEIQLTWEQRNPASNRRELTNVDLVTGDASVAVLGLDGQKWIGAATPIEDLGWVAYAGRREDLAMAPLAQNLLREGLLFVMVASVGALIAVFVGRTLSRPLRRLRDDALAIGGGERDRHIEVIGPAEVESLAEAFNRMAEQLREREEQRERFLQTTSHDLRHPLAIIQGHAQIVERRLSRVGADEQDMRSVQAIITTGRRMNTMIQDLVDTARLETGMLELRVKSVEPEKFAREVTARVGGLTSSDRIRVEIRDELPRIAADSERLERVLINLLSNALKYSPPEAVVTLTIEHRNGEVIFAIRDQGKGISIDELPLLFKLNSRTTSGRDQQDSLGLGLYIVKGLVDAHNGRVWAESIEDEGATFYVALPASSARS